MILALQKFSGSFSIDITGGEVGAGVGGTDGTRGVGVGENEGGQRQEIENYPKENIYIVYRLL